MNTNYTITVGNKKHEWTAETVESKLSQIGKLQGKNVCWIRSDLSVKKSNWLTRFFWKIAKHFSWMRKRFYRVDLKQSRSILTQIRKQIPNNKGITDLYLKAVRNFNRIAPKHSLPDTHPLVKPLNADQVIKLFDLGLKTPEEALEFVQQYGSQLESLNLSGLEIKNADLKFFFEACPNLLHFTASELFDDKALSALIKEFPSLQSLDLSWSRVTDNGLAQLKKLSSLQSLNVSQCTITNSGLEHVGELHSLQHLDLSDCSRSKPSGEPIGITAPGLRHLVNLSSLQYLNLRNLHIHDNGGGVHHIKELTSLKTLILKRCNINSESLGWLQNLPALKSLDLSFCQKVYDNGLKHLEKIPSLRLLNLTKCTTIVTKIGEHILSITPAGIQGLKTSNPELKILSHFTP